MPAPPGQRSEMMRLFGGSSFFDRIAREPDGTHTATAGDDARNGPAPPRSDADEGGQRDRQEAGRESKGNSQEPQDKDEPPKKKSRWPLIILAIVVVIAIIGGGVYWFLNRNLETTDDAYTDGNAISIAPKVSGYVIQRNVDDNGFVKAGDPMIRIDPRDYQTAVDQARANLQLAQVQLASSEIALQVTRVRAPADLLQAQAQLAQSVASQTDAQRNYQRQHAVDPRATTQNNVDQANSQLQSTQASVKSAQAQVQIAGVVAQTIATAEETVKQRQAQVAQAQANLAQAEINLGYTDLRAPQDGYITRRNVDVGTYVQAGQQMFYLVARDLWITANFKETQLARMRVGQSVDITVDAYPKLKLHGQIQSIQEGSGARFSAFPAENATGNFVKIVRRVPVKIVLQSGLAPDQILPLGISVEPTVNLQ